MCATCGGNTEGNLQVDLTPVQKARTKVSPDSAKVIAQRDELLDDGPQVLRLLRHDASGVRELEALGHALGERRGAVVAAVGDGLAHQGIATGVVGLDRP